jgi:molybdate transport system regulatory protein
VTADDPAPGAGEPAAIPRLRLRVVFGAGVMMGPGKADLLELIRDTGSISAAGRQMKMSYKRAWSLVETLNAMFRAPLVEPVRGGAGGGGARLTDTGMAVLARYRALEQVAAQAGAEQVGALRDLLGVMSDGK